MPASAPSSHRLILRWQGWAVAIGIGLLAVKFVAYAISGSNTILADALESIVNVVAGSVALYSLHLSAKPKDAEHPYGHGKIEFLSAGLEGMLILVAGLLAIWNGAQGLLRPTIVHQLELGGLLIAGTGVVNYTLGFWLEKLGREHHSLVLLADGKHLKSDGYSTAVVLLGVVCIWLTGLVWLDQVFAILAGLYIGAIGLGILRRSLGGIMDERDEDVLAPIIKSLNEQRRPAWIDIHNLRVIRYGRGLHVDCHVTLPWYYTLVEAHTELEAIAQLVSRQSNQTIEFFIHADPCLERCCSLCSVPNCPVRAAPWRERLVWTLDNLSLDQKHHLDEWQPEEEKTAAQSHGS